MTGGVAKSGGAHGNQQMQNNNLKVSGSKSVSDVDIKPGALIGNWLAERGRRFAGHNPRLLRLTAVPRLARRTLPG